MKKFVAAAALVVGISAGAIAYAQIKPGPGSSTAAPIISTEAEVTATDARSLASDQQVADARRYYRAQCNEYESQGFCECVTAGVAQALMPEEVRIAARTIGERINAQGDAGYSADTDATAAMSSAERIEQVEGHYADACAQFRG